MLMCSFYLLYNVKTDIYKAICPSFLKMVCKYCTYI